MLQMLAGLEILEGPIREMPNQRAGERRSDTASLFGVPSADRGFSRAERLMAIRLFRRLARDVAKDVRCVFCDHIKSWPVLPRAIAEPLADDIRTVSIPVLQYSMMLTEEDFLYLAERARDEESMKGLPADRLPTKLTMRLIKIISRNLQRRLTTRHELPDVLAAELVQHGKERALMHVISKTRSLQDVEAIVEHLVAARELTPTLILRALFVGKLGFCTIGIAALARISVADAQRMMANIDSKGFKVLYKRSGLPAELEEAFRIASGMVLDFKYATGRDWTVADAQRIIDRLIRSYDYLSPDGIESVLHHLGRRSGSFSCSKA